MNEEPVSPSPAPNLESLTSEQLAELASNPKMLDSVRAEACRRLKVSQNKANYLTFRWFLPADDEDKADAFDGLIAVCWKETKYRNRGGLFPAWRHIADRDTVSTRASPLSPSAGRLR